VAFSFVGEVERFEMRMSDAQFGVWFLDQRLIKQEDFWLTNNRAIQCDTLALDHQEQLFFGLRSNSSLSGKNIAAFCLTLCF